MANLGSYLPSPGSAVWRRDVATPPSSLSPSGPALGGARGEGATAEASNRVRHVVIRDAEIWEEPAPYVVYRINVLTEQDRWFLYRRYSQFHSLHKKLVKQYGVNKDLLPPKKISGNLSKQLIDKRRKLLESYLQKIIHSEPLVSRSPELQVFLDVPTHDVVKVTDVLTKHLYLNGDQLLQNATPIALSVNEMYAITRRLQLPRDPLGIDSDDVSADPAHLYSFVHQLERLRISLPPSPCSASCTPFDLSPFRSLHTIKLDGVPMSQVEGLVMIQQQLERVSVHNTLRSLQELLVEAVEERRNTDNTSADSSPSQRSLSSSVDSWRLSATAKFVGTRVVVQPWHRLHTLTLSHNIITQLDNSLQVLPSLRELTLSYNRLQVLKLQFLCLPSLEKLNLSHNHIHTIQDDKKVLERITHLSLSHNRLQSLQGVSAFVGVCVLNLAFNHIISSDDLNHLLFLRRLNMLSMTGNPISSSHGFRIVLQAKFLRRSRMVSIEGVQPTSKEQAKIKSYKAKYGSDPDLWPIAKSMHGSSHFPARKPHPLSYSGESERPGSSTPTTPHTDLSWQVQSEGGEDLTQTHLTPSKYATPTGSRPHSARSDKHSLDRISFPSSSTDSLDHSQYPYSKPHQHPRGPGGSGHFGTPQLPRGYSKRPVSNSFSGFMNEERFSVGGGVTHQAQGGKEALACRPEPDGQSDISSTSPDITKQRAHSSSQRSPYRSVPPCTPVPTDDRDVMATPITPAMLQSALDALEGIQDKATPLSLTPRQHSESSPNPVLPETVASALSKWISSQSLSSQTLQLGPTTSGGPSRSSLKTTPHLTTPPSSPEFWREESVSVPGGQGISAGDLITALSTLKVSGEEWSVQSAAPAVPAGTPNETTAGIEEWARLGIKPADVIRALSALTIQQEGGEEEEEEEEEEEDSHRDCSQYEEGSSSPVAVETPLSTVEPDYLCLFPESSRPPATSSSLSPGDTPRPQPQPEPGLEPGVESEHESSYEQESADVDESMLTQHLAHTASPAHQSDNDFAELDPYLSPSHVQRLGEDLDLSVGRAGEDLDLSVERAGEDLDLSVERAEVGVDVASEDTTLPEHLSPGQHHSYSPPESVLYS